MTKRAKSPDVPQCGVDIIEVRRIRALIARNPRFAPRIFTAQEIRYCAAKKNKWQHYAVRFAAKEAIWKALGIAGLSLKDIGIKNSASGKPMADLANGFKRYERCISVSLSHTEDYAVAFAVFMNGVSP